MEMPISAVEQMNADVFRAMTTFGFDMVVVMLKCGLKTPYRSLPYTKGQATASEYALSAKDQHRVVATNHFVVTARPRPTPKHTPSLGTRIVTIGQRQRQCCFGYTKSAFVLVESIVLRIIWHDALATIATLRFGTCIVTAGIANISLRTHDAHHSARSNHCSLCYDGGTRRCRSAGLSR